MCGLACCAGPAAVGCVVELRQGTHRLAATISLTAADSGLTIKAFDGDEAPVVTGAALLPNLQWTKYAHRAGESGTERLTRTRTHTHTVPTRTHSPPPTPPLLWQRHLTTMRPSPLTRHHTHFTAPTCTPHTTCPPRLESASVVSLQPQSAPWGRGPSVAMVTAVAVHPPPTRPLCIVGPVQRGARHHRTRPFCLAVGWQLSPPAS